MQWRQEEKRLSGKKTVLLPPAYVSLPLPSPPPATLKLSFPLLTEASANSARLAGNFRTGDGAVTAAASAADAGGRSRPAAAPPLAPPPRHGGPTDPATQTWWLRHAAPRSGIAVAWQTASPRPRARRLEKRGRRKLRRKSGVPRRGPRPREEGSRDPPLPPPPSPTPKVTGRIGGSDDEKKAPRGGDHDRGSGNEESSPPLPQPPPPTPPPRLPPPAAAAPRRLGQADRGRQGTG